MLQNESFQVLRHSKHISSDYGENEDYDGDSGRVPMYQQINSGYHSSSDSRGSMQEGSGPGESDGSASSSQPSCDNMEAFILDELQGVIAVERDKQERVATTLRRKEKTQARLQKKDQPPLRQVGPARQRASIQYVQQYDERAALERMLGEGRSKSQIAEA